MPLTDRMHRLGLGLNRGRPHLWIHGDDTTRFREMLPVLQALGNVAPRYAHLLTIEGEAERSTLRGLYRDAMVLPPPIDVGPAAGRFIARCDPRALIVLDPAAGLGPRTMAALDRRGCQTLRVSALANDADLRSRVVDEVGAMLRAAPLRGAADLDLLARARARPITALDTLAHELGRPRRLLCLGNGPSSLAPELSGMTFDCLFRVNWRWTNESRFVRPDMVFTGDGRGLNYLPDCILGIRTRTEAAGVLRSRRWRPRPWGIRYAALDTLPIVLNDRWWEARPTNGAAMIATAAALQPEQLVIAGIDLFEHPAGAYPGDAATPNAYLHVHDRNVEVAIIAAALAMFRGEAIILSPPLGRRLSAAAPR